MSHESRNSIGNDDKTFSDDSGPRSDLKMKNLFSGRKMSMRQSKIEKTATIVHPLDGLDQAAVKQTVEQLQKHLKHFKLENAVFLNFLKANDPQAVEDFEENVTHMLHRESSFGSKKTSVSFKLPSRSQKSDELEKTDTHQSIMSGFSHTTATEILKVNLPQRTDLVMREMDNIQIKLEELFEKWVKVKLIMVSKIEELETQKIELEESLESFEKFRQSPEEVTFQKFIKFMDDWSKKFHQLVDKLRLRYSSLKVQYQKTCAILANKRLIGENLQEIDFEQLRIENVHLVDKIEKQGLLLLELKRMTGAGNLTLSQQKKSLLSKLGTKEKIVAEIRKIEEEIIKSDNEFIKLNKELDDVKDEYDYIKEKVTKYSAPDILDYIRKKVELENLKRDSKIWTRRVNVKSLALNVATMQLKKLIGGHPIDPLWLA